MAIEYCETCHRKKAKAWLDRRKNVCFSHLAYSVEDQGAKVDCLRYALAEAQTVLMVVGFLMALKERR